MSDLDFAADGACVDAPPAVFFPDTAFYGDDYAPPEAVALCAVCPVRQACREWALDHEDHGIWAGTTAKARRRIRRLQGRQIQPIETMQVDTRPSRAVALWRAGWTALDIADQLDVAAKTVHRWLAAAGFDSTPPPDRIKPRRTRHERMRSTA